MSNPRLPKVFLTGADHSGWALDIDHSLMQKILGGLVEFTDTMEDAEIIHSVNAESLLEMPDFAKRTAGKKVIAHFTSPPSALFELVPHLYRACGSWICVAQSSETEEEMKKLGLKQILRVSYPGEIPEFFPLASNDEALVNLRKQLALPDDKYIIGSFQRDSLGADLTTFKPQKGADVLLAILCGLRKRTGTVPFHVLLAGPRRHWLRKKLEEEGIPYSFAGTINEGDDYPLNILSLDQLNLLTNLLDLYIIPSRFEGAPQALFETIAAKRKIISSDIAVPHELLSPSSRFDSVSRAIDLIREDMQKNCLQAEVEGNYLRWKQCHSLETSRAQWKEIYSALPDSDNLRDSQSSALERKPAVFGSIPLKLALSKGKQLLHREKKITLWGPRIDGPYGGGNQVFKAIEAELIRRGYRVAFNAEEEADAHFMNSAWFDTRMAARVIPLTRGRNRVVHRIDGPIAHYRGSDRKKDDEIFELNEKLATVTAFQCLYSWAGSLKMGYSPVNPVIIRNAADPGFFFPPEGRTSLKSRKIILVSSSWSSNRIKGFDTYQYLDKHLDFSRYEYRFIGQSPLSFDNIQIQEPLPSAALGEQLRECDIYITASKNDPASNSLLEALCCGLPALYLRSGGHHEITGFAGLGFDTAEEIPGLLERITEDYEAYLKCLYTRNIRTIVDQYLAAIRWS